MSKTAPPNLVHAEQNESVLQDRPWRALPPEVAAALRPFVPDTAEEMIDAIREAVPAYARPLEGAFGEALRTGVERALTEFLDEVEGKRSDDGGTGGDIYAALGRGELTEGRDMAALLAAYRVGARVAWRRTAAAGRQVGFDADTVSLLAEAFFAYVDQLSARSAAGFAEEQSLVAGEAARRRRALLALLVQSPSPERALVEAAAREAHWEPPPTLAALVWRDESEQPVARRLPLGSLAAALDDGLIWAMVPDAAAPGRVAELEAAVGSRPSALGPSVPWTDAATSAQRALAAFRLMSDGMLDDEALVVADRRLAELIIHADRSLISELAERRLAPLAGRSERGRARLLETLAAWLDQQGNVPRTAEALHVHPQTVRYRVGQLRDLFGDDLDDPRARFELSLAVRAGGA
jgi:hypothetical protein